MAQRQAIKMEQKNKSVLQSAAQAGQRTPAFPTKCVTKEDCGLTVVMLTRLERYEYFYEGKTKPHSPN
jgi:hypothetical protein